MITFIDRNGPPEGLTCPAILCEHCGEPIHQRGLVLWQVNYGDRGERPSVSPLAFVHQGRCDQAFDAAHPGHWCSRELDQFLEQLAHNFREPFELEPNVEYIAPKPSTWRLGRYRRKGVAP